MSNKNKLNMFLITIILFIIMLTSYTFITNATNSLYEEKSNYLLELANKSSDTVRSMIESDLETMRVISDFLSSNSDFDVQTSLTVIDKFVDKPFNTLGIILPDGSSYSTDDTNQDLKDFEFFKKAMDGECNVSDRITDLYGGQEINVYSAPVYKTNKIVAVVFGVKTQRQFSRSLKIESFGGEGYSYIIKSDGSPVVSTDNPDSIGEFENLFEVVGDFGINNKQLEKMISDINAEKSACLEFVRDDKYRQLCYTKVGVNDWYVLSIVPDSAISRSSDNLILGLIIIIIIIIISVFIISAKINISLNRNNKALAKLAYYDEVAQCSNWQKFSLDSEEIISKSSDTNYAMIMIDVIKFKVINDIYGYKIGNTVLQCIARAIDINVSYDETFCRMSGDKFNILMKYENNENVIERLENIVSNIKGCFDTYNIQIVAGIYANFDKTLEIRVVSDRSGISKSIAKRQNYVWYHFYEEENRIDILKEKKIENAMERALENQEFEVYFQPKYSLLNEKIYGAEALVRWNKPGAGVIYPDGFIPVFERNGFIRNLDLYVFDKVCELISKWSNDSLNINIVPISVNISRVDLVNRDIAYNLKKITQKHNVKPEHIEIELVESAIFEDIDKLIDVMQKIKNEGFLVSIDDFGRGYSSLGAIKNLPVDFIKIDKSFLVNLDDKGEKLITSIVSMIKTLGIFSVAEGVETEDQVKFLKKTGCDIAQGFFYSTAITISEFEKVLQVDKSNVC